MTFKFHKFRISIKQFDIDELSIFSADKDTFWYFRFPFIVVLSICHVVLVGCTHRGAVVPFDDVFLWRALEYAMPLAAVSAALLLDLLVHRHLVVCSRSYRQDCLLFIRLFDRTRNVLYAVHDSRFRIAGHLRAASSLLWSLAIGEGGGGGATAAAASASCGQSIVRYSGTQYHNAVCCLVV